MSFCPCRYISCPILPEFAPFCESPSHWQDLQYLWGALCGIGYLSQRHHLRLWFYSWQGRPLDGPNLGRFRHSKATCKKFMFGLYHVLPAFKIIYIYMEVSWNRGNRKIHLVLKPMVLGYHHFRKPGRRIPFGDLPVMAIFMEPFNLPWWENHLESRSCVFSLTGTFHFHAWSEHIKEHVPLNAWD